MSGGSFRAWHLIVIVAGVAALAWGGYRLFSSRGSSANWASSLYGVDVVTGQVYEYSTKDRGVVFPAEAPDTHERTIIPADMDPETNEWFFETRWVDYVRGLGDKAKAVTDLSAGKVKTTGEPKRVQ